MASRVRPATHVPPGGLHGVQRGQPWGPRQGWWQELRRGARRRAGELSAALAGLALALVLCPMPWLWLGLGGGIFAITASLATYRDGRVPGGARLLAAAAAAVALLAVTLAMLRVALSIAATVRLEQLLS